MKRFSHNRMQPTQHEPAFGSLYPLVQRDHSAYELTVNGGLLAQVDDDVQNAVGTRKRVY